VSRLMEGYDKVNMKVVPREVSCMYRLSYQHRAGLGIPSLLLQCCVRACSHVVAIHRLYTSCSCSSGARVSNT
jgi:hypothetical protein